MTDLPKVSDLTPDQVRVMVAELMGLQFTRSGPWRLTLETSKYEIPDYPSDLNATAVMEQSLVGDSAPENDELMEKYVEALHGLTGADLNPSAVAIFATADQRSRAFLIAKGRARL